MLPGLHTKNKSGFFNFKWQSEKRWLKNDDGVQVLLWQRRRGQHLTPYALLQKTTYKTRKATKQGTQESL